MIPRMKSPHTDLEFLFSADEVRVDAGAEWCITLKQEEINSNKEENKKQRGIKRRERLSVLYKKNKKILQL